MEKGENKSPLGSALACSQVSPAGTAEDTESLSPGACQGLLTSTVGVGRGARVGLSSGHRDTGELIKGSSSRVCEASLEPYCPAFQWCDFFRTAFPPARCRQSSYLRHRGGANEVRHGTQSHAWFVEMKFSDLVSGPPAGTAHSMGTAVVHTRLSLAA